MYICLWLAGYSRLYSFWICRLPWNVRLHLHVLRGSDDHGCYSLCHVPTLSIVWRRVEVGVGESFLRLSEPRRCSSLAVVVQSDLPWISTMYSIDSGLPRFLLAHYCAFKGRRFLLAFPCVRHAAGLITLRVESVSRGRILFVDITVYCRCCRVDSCVACFGR
jgi:hypothetical protein